MRRLPVFFVTLALSLQLTSTAWAQSTLNATESATVTATVPERNEPDTPTLIAPGNGATIGTTTPTFIFDPSLGTVFVTHYQLWIDGNKNTDHIPTSNITITTNALTALSEGAHTWFIKAIGNNGVNRNSATWSFTIDTTAPPLNLTSVVGQTYTNQPSLTTADRTPVFIGSSEAGVGITISLAGPTTSVNLDTVADANGDFSLVPSFPLPPETYTVSVSATDASGNTTTLPSFTLTITIFVSGFTIPLPLPLPDLTFNLPFLSGSLIPQLPTALVAVPIAPESMLSYLPWLIILLPLIHLALFIRYLSQGRTGQTIYLYISLWLPFLGLVCLLVLTFHWLPGFFSLFMLPVMALEHRFVKTSREHHN